MKDYIGTIVKNEKIADNIHAVTFALNEDCKVRCGQFGNIAVGGTHLLRRPIAICKAEGREVTFCYQIKLSAQARNSGSLSHFIIGMEKPFFGLSIISFGT